MLEAVRSVNGRPSVPVPAKVLNMPIRLVPLAIGIQLREA